MLADVGRGMSDNADEPTSLQVLKTYNEMILSHLPLALVSGIQNTGLDRKSVV